jgi:hypothetical protein
LDARVDNVETSEILTETAVKVEDDRENLLDMVVELGELRDFVARYDGFMNLLRQLNFNIVIELIIDAFTNFIVAIAWPVYWLGDIAGEYIWIWFAVAYGAYWAGAKLALSRHQRP